MISHLVKPLSFVALVALTACGGGGGGGDTDGGSGGGGGGVDPTPGSNGLPFGAVGQRLPEAEGQTVTMSSASFQVGNDPEDAPSIVPATITVGADFFDDGGSSLNGTITIFGQTVEITNGTGNLTPDEEVVLTYEPNRTGTYAAAIEVSVSSMDGINGEAAYVFGFETDPATIAARPGGTVTYTGDFQSFGSLGGAPNSETEYAGGMTVGVDFTGTGNATVALDGQVNGTQDVDMGGTIGLAGNGFAGGLTCVTGCSGTASQIDATFYGPNADELGGVLAIDITVTGVGAYDGVGTFILPAE
ncbi:transferrin-binding protein-like solute binding protein [Yoonia sp.]|uniref:transferrin-binding protein-like solute binding protein n=1 Tax=Yoonia sp. TaxID=2212373 RepID=UPI002E06AE1B|nr:transferrin-binding protein-like solute binding protein [Yoonia sp.]